MAGFTTRLAIELLRRSGKVELIELADWIEDAPRAAAASIVDLLGHATSSGGGITPDVVREALKVKTGFRATEADEMPRMSRSPFLEKYQEVVAAIIAAGRWREGILLHGFIHTSECSSLWRFERECSVHAVDEPGGLPSIRFRGSGCSVTLLNKVTDEELQDVNRQIGENPARIIAALTSKDDDEVVSVAETTVMVKGTRAVTKTKMDMTTFAKSEYHTTERSTEPVDIDTRHWSGIESLIRSLPPALEARATSLTYLQGLVKKVT